MKKALNILLWSAALTNLAAGLFGPIYAIFVEEIGGDILTAGTSYAAFAIVAGILTYLIGKWEDRVKHQEKLIMLGYLLGSLGFIGLLLIKQPWHLFLIQVIFGIGQAVGTPAYDSVYSRSLDKGKFSSEWGAWECMNWIVLGIAGALGGYVANEFGFRILFWFMLLLSILGFFTSLFLIKRK